MPDNLFRALSDTTRLRAIVLLRSEGELCVCELTHALDLIQPKISRHLAILREEGIVSDRRAGQWVYYRLNPELPGWAQTAVEATSTGVQHTAPFPLSMKHQGKQPARAAASFPASTIRAVAEV